MPGAATPLPSFKDLFEHASDGILILADDGHRIVEINPRGCEMLGVVRSHLVGRDLGEFLAEDLDELTLFTRTVHNHGVAWTDQLALPGTKGMPVDVTACGYQGRKAGLILLTMRETTEARARVEADTQALAADRARYYEERMERFRTDILNMTAHELRTPLTPIILQLAVLKRNLSPLLTEEHQVSLDRINDNIARLQAHVQSIVQAVENMQEAQG